MSVRVQSLSTSPPQKPKTGHPAKDHRLVLNGILWVLRTGAPWRDAPPEYGPWQILSTRFYRWVKAGIWDQILAALQRQADAEGDVDWTLHHVDGSVIRAHQQAAGAPKGGSAGRSA
jgi:transposase